MKWNYRKLPRRLVCNAWQVIFCGWRERRSVVSQCGRCIEVQLSGVDSLAVSASVHWHQSTHWRASGEHLFNLFAAVASLSLSVVCLVADTWLICTYVRGHVVHNGRQWLALVRHRLAVRIDIEMSSQARPPVARVFSSQNHSLLLLSKTLSFADARCISQ